MIERASPVQLRKALELAHQFSKMGVNFVPMPVANDAEQRVLVAQALDKLAQMEQMADEPAEEIEASAGRWSRVSTVSGLPTSPVRGSWFSR